MKALVTGGTGFIGSHLCEYLLSKGMEIYALVRDLSNLRYLKGLNINFIKGDLFTIPALPSDIRFVFHLAGKTKSLKLATYYTVNAQGTASLFKNLRKQRIFPKVIYLSSLASAGPSQGSQARKETDPPQPVSPYGESKLRGEKEALKNKKEFPVVILRVGAVFGPRDRDFLSYFKFMKQGILPSFGFRPKLMSICYVKDVVRAIYLAAVKEVESGEIINIGDPHPYYYDDIGKLVGEVMGLKLKNIIFPIPAIYLIALVTDMASLLTGKVSILSRSKYKELKQSGWVADIGKAKEKLGFETQYSLKEAARETLNWYSQQGWL